METPLGAGGRGGALPLFFAAADERRGAANKAITQCQSDTARLKKKYKKEWGPDLSHVGGGRALTTLALKLRSGRVIYLFK